jgi:hypothetical protein
MSIIDEFAHGLLGVVALFAGIIVGGLDLTENGLRFLLSDVGLGADVQTVTLIFIELMFLLGVLRLLRGRFRLILVMLMLLLMAHTLGRIARVP